MDETAHTSISSVSRRRERLGNKKTSFNIFVKSKKLGHPSKLTNLPEERSDTPPRAAAPTRPNLLEARTARILRPSVPLSHPPSLQVPSAVCGAAAHATRAALARRRNIKRLRFRFPVRRLYRSCGNVSKLSLAATGAAATLPADLIPGIAPSLLAFFVWGPELAQRTTGRARHR